MTKVSLATIMALTALGIASCASRDYRRQDFIDERNRCVGKIFGDPANWWCRWTDSVARQPGGAFTDEYEIAPAWMGECRWIYTVDRASWQVIAWRFAGGQNDCFTRIDWLGAW